MSESKKLHVVLDPPIDAPEFGNWKGDPNVVLENIHDYVSITIDLESTTKQSVSWFLSLVQDRIVCVSEE